VETILAALIITGIWAWVVPVLFFFIILAFTENDHNYWAGISLIIILGVLQHSGIIALFSNPFLLILYLVGYFLLGGAWSVVKWYFLIQNKAKSFKKCKQKFIDEINGGNNNHNLSITDKEFPEDVMQEFKRYLVSNYLSYSVPHRFKEKGFNMQWIMPQAINHKQKIVTWILWWPTSAFWTLLNEPFVRIAKLIYERFQGIYGRITNHAFKDLGL